MGALIADWYAHHPILGPLATMGTSLVLSVALTFGILAALHAVRRKRPDRHGVPTVQAVRDMIRSHNHTELSEDFPLVLTRLRDAEANIMNLSRYTTTLQRSNQSLQRAVQALQRKAQAEGKPARKPRGKKAEPQDAWDIINRDDADA